MNVMDTDQSTQSGKDFLHDQYGVVAMFLLIPATLLWACLNPDIYWMILLPLLIMLAYDLHFRFAYRGEWALRGRDYESTLHGIRAAIQYTSILIGFIGIVLGGFLEKDLINAIGAKLSESGLLKCYTMALVAIPTFMLLFIPVSYTQSKIDRRKWRSHCMNLQWP